MSKTRLFAILLTIAGPLLLLSGYALMVRSQEEPNLTVTVTVEPTQAPLVPLPQTISGVVEDEAGPVAGAIVQLQGTPYRTQTADDGTFTFNGIEGTMPTALTAWIAGHYIGWTPLNPYAADWTGGTDMQIMLRPLPVGDNSEYDWYEFEGVKGSASCGLCHREYEEWQSDTHSHAATNPRFLSMYTGTDINGEPGQTTKWDSEGIPLPPDPNLPYFGPGFRLDNHNRAGNCATCHTPIASKSPNAQNCAWSGCHTDLTIERSNGFIDPPAIPLAPRAAEGITCEFCHKISEVYLDPETRLPYPDMPGILSVQLRRPSDESDQVFFGTLVDVSRDDSYLPLLSESAFCASCHYGVFGGVVGMKRVAGGTVVYNSYGEWLESPYSDPETGQTCQDCHMTVSAANWFVTPERGGLTRDYMPLHNHTMRGSGDKELLQNTVTMVSSAERDGNQIQVEVSITNDRAGHDVPTGVPIRSMILVIEARDAEGNLLTLSDGPVNPDFSGDYGGLPGKTFAKVLRDDLTGEAPTAAFWRPVTIIEDTRIAAMATDITHYAFDAPANEAATIHVRLLFRRAFYELAIQKGWNDSDILMEQETMQLPTN